MLAAPLRSRFQLLFVAAARTFIVTWLLMVALGIALAVGAGHYLPDVQPLPRGLLQFFIVLQFLAVGAFVAGRRALSAAVVHGVRSLGLGQRGLGSLFRRYDESTDLPHHDNIGVRPGSLADEQLARALRTVTAGRRLRAGPWSWFRGYLMDLVGGIAVSRVRGKRQRGEKVETAEIKSELESTIDDLLLARVNFILYVWTFLVVAGLVFANLLLIYLARLLSQAG
jgi:hypothetical protein